MNHKRHILQTTGITHRDSSWIAAAALLVMLILGAIGMMFLSWSVARAAEAPQDFKVCSDTACVQVIVTPVVAPPTCPPQPADETRPGTCPAGTTGTWTQTLTHSSAAPPICWQAGEWLPASPPAGACVATPPVNSPPTISGTPIAAVAAGSAYSFTPTASDANGDPLTFVIFNRPSWATFSNSTGALTGTPSAAHVGVHSSIRISVSDGKVSSSTPIFTITVTAPPQVTLTAPVLSQPTVVANAVNAGRFDVRATWTAVAGATRYELRRCVGAGCTSMGVVCANELEPKCTNPNLPGNFTYRYAAYAKRCPTTACTSGVEYGPASNIVTVVTSGTVPPPPPPPPTGTGTASMSWDTPLKNTDGTPATIASYRFQYSPVVGPAGPSLSQTLNLGRVNQHVFTGLSSGRWAFTIIAIDTQGRTSLPSDIAYRDVP